MEGSLPGDAGMRVAGREPHPVTLHRLKTQPVRQSRRNAKARRAASIGETLLDYLRDKLDLDDLQFASLPSLVDGGWETHLYRFQLASAQLPAIWTQPLMMRLHAHRRGRLRARHEFEAPRFLADRGF